MVRHLSYSLPTLAIALSLCFAQTGEIKSRSQPSSPINQREKEINSSPIDLMLPAYKSLSDPRPAVDLPVTAGSWVLEVETIGGLTGGRKTYVLLKSGPLIS